CTKQFVRKFACHNNQPCRYLKAAASRLEQPLAQGRPSDAFRRSPQGSIALSPVVQDDVELLLELQPGSVQPAADRANRQLKDLGDLVVVAVVHLSQHEDGPMLIAEPAQRSSDLDRPLFAKQPLIGPFAAIKRFQAQFVALRQDGSLLPPPPA